MVRSSPASATSSASGRASARVEFLPGATGGAAVSRGATAAGGFDDEPLVAAAADTAGVDDGVAAATALSPAPALRPRCIRKLPTNTASTIALPPIAKPRRLPAGLRSTEGG